MVSLNLQLPTAGGRLCKDKYGTRTSTSASQIRASESTSRPALGSSSHKRIHCDKTSAPVALVPEASAAPPSREPFYLLEAKIRDLKYLILNVFDAQIAAMLSLAPRFSVVLQAMY